MTPVELLSLLLECSTAAASNSASINPACPALAPPPGELPLHPNAPSLWSHSVGVLAACCVLVCLSLALRMFTRSYITKRRFACEDGKIAFVSAHQKHIADTSPALMIFAVVGPRPINFATLVSKGYEQILFIPIAGLQLKAYTYGGSKHQWNVTIGGLFTALCVGPLPESDPLPEKQSSDRVQYVYTVQILYCLALYAAKLSILLQIKHIFEGTKQLTSIVFWASWATIALVTCAYIITTMLLVFSCTPVRKVGSHIMIPDALVSSH